MKIKSAKSTALLAVFLLISSQAFAKENAKENLLKADLNPKVSAEKKDSREEIHSFDYDKLFTEAQKLYKSARSWNKLKCEPKTGFICSKHECNKFETKTNLVLDKKNGTITRCDGKNCETFEAEFEQTGVYVNIQSKGPVGTLIRVLGDYRYKEISTVALDAYVANGECKVVTE